MPTGWYVLSFRARSSEELSSQFYWATNTHRESEAYARRFAVGEAGDDWRDYHFYFQTDGNLIRLRLDPGDRAGQQVEFDWIRLERSNEEVLRALADELIRRVEQGDSNADNRTRLAQLLVALDGASDR